MYQNFNNTEFVQIIYDTKNKNKYTKDIDAYKVRDKKFKNMEN